MIQAASGKGLSGKRLRAMDDFIHAPECEEKKAAECFSSAAFSLKDPLPQQAAGKTSRNKASFGEYIPKRFNARESIPFRQ
jgi:hypothetical protein